MRRHSDIEATRPLPRESVVTVTVRTPEAAKAIHGAGHVLRVIAWVVGALLLSIFAWYGGFGATTHAFIHLTVAGAGLYWAIAVAHDLWRDSDRTTLQGLTVRLTPEIITVDTPGRPPIAIDARDREVRFASRPHWLARREERDERRVGYPIGFDYRDAWEVWCEAGLDVVLITAVAREDDARAIVRQLSEEMIAVSRGPAPDAFDRRRTEPV